MRVTLNRTATAVVSAVTTLTSYLVLSTALNGAAAGPETSARATYSQSDKAAGEALDRSLETGVAGALSLAFGIGVGALAGRRRGWQLSPVREKPASNRGLAL